MAARLIEHGVQLLTQEGHIHMSQIADFFLELNREGDEYQVSKVSQL